MGNSVSDGKKDTHALDQSVLALAREIADTINAGPSEERDILREMAINAVRDGVRVAEPATAVPAADQRPFNPFGIAIPLVFAGAILIVLFPPVGLLMFGVAAIMVVWGVAATLVARD